MSTTTREKDWAAILSKAEEQVEAAGSQENLLKREYSYDAPEVGGVIWLVDDGEVYLVVGTRDGGLAPETLHHIDGEDHGASPDVYAYDHEVAATLLDAAGLDDDAAWHREQAARFWKEAEKGGWLNWDEPPKVDPKRVGAGVVDA